MTSIANGILTTAVFVLLDKAAQTRVKSSPKRGVKQVDRRIARAPSTQARDPLRASMPHHLAARHGLGLH
jgi:hypothetical protein